jgi:hypothetical protein
MSVFLTCGQGKSLERKGMTDEDKYDVTFVGLVIFES